MIPVHDSILGPPRGWRLEPYIYLACTFMPYAVEFFQKLPPPCFFERFCHG